ncbi:NADH dehydrogenase subunit 3 (mitochondrion) [Macrosteles quadrilineatus]|uniref:NADH-ubiquinone oxidoreductase chain 3 n=1 Tax=Macrosteles quadrilineatus TaxID=74068 RepID=A0A343CXA7_MACQU|nr:NADH dehydrogenase subunit 3 [Macrosteles quadrilineatus]ARQ26989.1 NADH dehydrogenase subunit 3 [Macrosteles quadrilineatus]
MNLMLNSMIIIMTIMTIILMMITTLSKKTILDTQKSTPFECGFNPMSYNRLPFSIHFFMIAVIFLIFDIEIILIMPMILTMKMVMLKYWIITSMTFILILILGLMHEWKNGMLKWTE